jgi:protocadherin gamma subfamily A
MNDHAPEFPATSYVLSIPENQPRGTSVFALTAADEDIGENAKLYYQITNGDSAGDKFYMDSIFVAGTGVIKIKEVGEPEVVVAWIFFVWLVLSCLIADT